MSMYVCMYIPQRKYHEWGVRKSSTVNWPTRSSKTKAEAWIPRSWSLSLSSAIWIKQNYLIPFNKHLKGIFPFFFSYDGSTLFLSFGFGVLCFLLRKTWLTIATRGDAYSAIETARLMLPTRSFRWRWSGMAKVDTMAITPTTVRTADAVMATFTCQISCVSETK